jgi:hypothetical protein
MNTVLRRAGWLAFALAIVGLVAWVWIGTNVANTFGPRDPPTTIITPTTIGVVDGVIYNDNILHFQLDGSPMTLDPAAHLVLSKPNDGELLLLGTYDGRPWYLAIPRPAPGYPSGCYWLGTRAWNEPNAILFDVGGDYASGRLGLRLEKADGFQADFWGGRKPEVYRQTDVLCVNRDGEVTGTIDALRDR